MLTSPQSLKLDVKKIEFFYLQFLNAMAKTRLLTTISSKNLLVIKDKRRYLNFISQYLSDQDRQYLEPENYQVKYLSYYWAFNK